MQTLCVFLVAAPNSGPKMRRTCGAIHSIFCGILWRTCGAFLGFLAGFCGTKLIFVYNK